MKVECDIYLKTVVRFVVIGVVIEFGKDNFCGVMGIEVGIVWFGVYVGGKKDGRIFMGKVGERKVFRGCGIEKGFVCVFRRDLSMFDIWREWFCWEGMVDYLRGRRDKWLDK